MTDKQYNVLNPNSESALILTCEHASASIPAEYNDLGLSEKDINRHIARDKGCLEVTQKLAEKLGCFAIMGTNSRLLIDLNRREDEAELIVAESDKTLVPGNQNVTDSERKKRIKEYYKPYYQAVKQQIEKLQNQGKKPVLFSVHSFTPQMRGGTYRPWQAGILYNQPQELAKFLYQELDKKQTKKVGENVPYDLRKYKTGTAVVLGEGKGVDYAVIEIRDNEFDDLSKGSDEWADMLAPMLENYMNKK